MKQDNRKGLLDFLRDNQVGDEGGLWLPVLMEPFFTYAETGHYWLHPASKLDPNDVANCISQATGKPVSKVVFVSVDSLIKEGETCGEFVDLRELFTGIGMSLGTSLLAAHARAVWTGLEKRGSSLSDLLTTRLEEGLWSDMRKKIMPQVDADLWYSMRSGLGACIQYYLGYLIIGDRERAGQLAPLMSLFASAVPLGSLLEDPGTYVVLSA